MFCAGLGSLCPETLTRALETSKYCIVGAAGKIYFWRKKLYFSIQYII